MSTPRPPDRDERPLSELLSDVTSQVQALVRKEMELAQAEVKVQVNRAVKGAAAFAAAGVVAFIAAIALVFAAAWGLAEVLPAGFAFLAVGVVLLAGAGVAFTQGRKKMAQVSPMPQQTVETVKQDVATAKDSVQRGMQETSAYPDAWRRS